MSRKIAHFHSTYPDDLVASVNRLLQEGWRVTAIYCDQKGVHHLWMEWQS